MKLQIIPEPGNISEGDNKDGALKKQLKMINRRKCANKSNIYSRIRGLKII